MVLVLRVVLVLLGQEELLEGLVLLDQLGHKGLRVLEVLLELIYLAIHYFINRVYILEPLHLVSLRLMEVAVILLHEEIIIHQKFFQYAQATDIKLVLIINVSKDHCH